MPEVRLQATEKQLIGLRDRARNVLMDGGFGTAKSRWLCMMLYYRASFPGARECLYRKYLSTLKKTTLKTLLDGDGEAPPVIPEGSYTHNKSERTIKLNGGGEIIYTGLDDPKQVKSLNLTGIHGDEVTELTEEEYGYADKRPRMTHPLGNQHCVATNPGSPSHFLCRLFGVASGHMIRPGHSRIHTMPEDNPFLPADYIESLKAMEGVAYKRYYLGQWVGAEGLVYELWDRERNVRESKVGKPARVIVAVDDGFANPLAALRIEVDGDGRAHVADMVYKDRLSPPEKVERVKSIAHGAEVVLVDPSAPDVIELFRSAGMNVQAATNDVLPGIQLVSARLPDAGDGRPRLTVDPACEWLIREMESYSWKPNKATGGVRDEPVKQFDHAVDALRYGIAYLDNLSAASVYVYAMPTLERGRDFTEDDDRMWTRL